MLMVSCFAYNLIYAVIYYQVSVLVAEQGYGNESVAALLSTLGTVGSCILCILFGALYSKLKKGNHHFRICGTLSLLSAALPGIRTGHGRNCMYAVRCFLWIRFLLLLPEMHGRRTQGAGILLYLHDNSHRRFWNVPLHLCLHHARKLLGTTGILKLLPVAIAASGIGAVLSIICTVMDKKNPSDLSMQEVPGK